MKRGLSISGKRVSQLRPDIGLLPAVNRATREAMVAELNKPKPDFAAVILTLLDLLARS